MSIFGLAPTHFALKSDTMSEFSISYHIRMENPRDMQQRLRQSKIGGIVFGPADSWLSFVPYENLPAYERRGDSNFAQYLAQILGDPPLPLRRGPRLGFRARASKHAGDRLHLLVGSGSE
jgi:hypothetical protein